jgi:molybdopterin-guanine dinucleotide biosynthesis protein B
MPALFGIAGYKNSGKTTLTERLVSELSGRGYVVSTVKHAHHGFEIDQPGRDSFRHREAGAREVAIVSRRRWVIMYELRQDDEPSLSDVVARFGPCDLVLTEGYKHDEHPKLEVRRTGLDHPKLAGSDPHIVAVASDAPLDDVTVPVLDLDDVAAIADFVVKCVGLEMPS